MGTWDLGTPPPKSHIERIRNLPDLRALGEPLAVGQHCGALLGGAGGAAEPFYLGRRGGGGQRKWGEKGKNGVNLPPPPT